MKFGEVFVVSDDEGQCDVMGARVDYVSSDDGDDIEVTNIVTALGVECGSERMAREPTKRSNSKRSCSVRRELSTSALEGSTNAMKVLKTENRKHESSSD